MNSIKKVAIAPELNINYWIDADGNEVEPIHLSDFEGKFKILFCFQSWCPGCHSKGLPDLKKMVDALADNDKVEFLAIQTVFEGHETNTKEKIIETQKKYNIKCAFGHDQGDDLNPSSSLMRSYKTGGTPWFIFINQKNHIVFSDFHLNPDGAIDFLKSI